MYKNVICKQQLYVAINLSVNKRPNNIFMFTNIMYLYLYIDICAYIYIYKPDNRESC